MRLYFIYISFIILILLASTGCDVIDSSNYRKQATVDTSTNTFKKNILLEDYTAFRCDNCPRAHLEAKALEDAYSGQVIVIAIHAGPLAQPLPIHKYDFRTPAGTELDNFFGLSAIGLPNGMINRMGYPTKEHIIADGKWGSVIPTLINDKPRMTIKLDNSFDNGTKEIDVKVSVNYLEATSSDDYLAVYILEDSIVQYQYDVSATPPDVNNYVHNHVLRGAINGTWGEQLDSISHKSGTVITKEYKYTIPSGKDWTPEKLKILAYIHDYRKTYQVWQCAEKVLIGN